MKPFRISILGFSLLCFGVTMAQAQSGLDAYFGVGTANVDSSGQNIDTFNDGTLFGTPKLTGAFGKAGADLMFTPHFGVGGDVDFRFNQGAYAGLKYRPIFYDFYGIYQPITRSRRVVPEFFGGLGAANLRFFVPQSSCNAFTGCSTSNTFVDSSNHFQVRMGAGLALYATSHIFFRPQVDAHWINNNFQFGSNWVPEYSVSIGYRFGEH
jgi:outer membrane protein W